MTSRNSTAPGMIGLPGKWPFAALCPTARTMRAVLAADVLLLSSIGDQASHILARQLAKRVARQCRNKADRPWQEGRVDPPPKLGQDSLRATFRCHDERGEAAHAITVAFVRHHERAVADTIDGVEMIVQVDQ